MICTMPILFTIIKVLAILAGILLILLAIALLMHLGFSVEYRPDRLRVVAIYGPLRRTVWSHRLRRARGRRVKRPAFALKSLKKKNRWSGCRKKKQYQMKRPVRRDNPYRKKRNGSRAPLLGDWSEWPSWRRRIPKHWATAFCSTCDGCSGIRFLKFMYAI